MLNVFNAFLSPRYTSTVYSVFPTDISTTISISAREVVLCIICVIIPFPASQNTYVLYECSVYFVIFFTNSLYIIFFFLHGFCMPFDNKGSSTKLCCTTFFTKGQCLIKCNNYGQKYLIGFIYVIHIDFIPNPASSGHL